MNWKDWRNWSYWMRGSVIGFVLTFVLFAFAVYITGSRTCWDAFDPITKTVFCTPKWNFALNFRSVSITAEVSAQAGIFGLGLGAVIGYFYGKIKNRKRIVSG